MKRKFKIALLMFLSMLLSVTPLSAADAELVFDIDMPEHEKEIARELQASDHEFFLKVDEVIVSATKEVFLESDYVSSEEGNILTDETISPLGAIGSNYMTAYTVVVKINGTGKSYRLSGYFTWDTKPFFLGNDGIALAWSDDFTLSSSKMSLYYTGTIYNGYYNSQASLSGVAPEKGVGYKFPLTYGNNYPSSLKSGRIDAEIYKTSGTGSANVTLKYVHTKIGIGSPSFGFSGSGPSISISIISTYDTKEAYSSWNY